MVKLLALLLWAVATGVTILVASLPLGVEAQLVLATGALAAMLAIKLVNIKGLLRPVFLGLGTFVILRYLLWRLAYTLPPIDSPLDFAAGFVLVAAECYCVAMLFLSLFTVADPITRPAAPRVSDDEAPTVDVFIPTYDESIEIVAPTVAAAKRMIYPDGKLNVFLLDDGGTEEKIHSDDAAAAARALNRRQSFQALCAELGACYLTRDENRHAKAGNLNNGLANSEGELVAVFDADHAPARDFLLETVGFFTKDEKLFLVQTPHFFLNPDPIEKNIGAVGMPAENEMFYGLVQKGLDKWNAAFFCGSAALLRRQALDEVGGFHGSSVTEDAETALELHSRGWNSLYVEKPMIAGLQPETFESFIGQRSRWCRGMVQMLLLKNPLFLPGLTPPQRLSYLSSSLFWLFPLSRMVFIFAPLLYIFFDMKIYIANSQEFMAYTLTYMVSGLMIQSYVFGKVRWPWTSDLYEYILSVMLFRAVLGVFVDPRRPKFNVTAKGQTLDEDQLSSLAWPYFALFCIVALSMVMLGLRFANEPASRDLITVVGVWSAFNLCLTGIGLGAVSELRERRSVPRVAGNAAASLVIGSETLPVAVEDMSFGGLRVRMLGPTYLPPRGTGVLRIETGDPSAPVLETPVVNAGRRLKNETRGVGLKFYGLNGDRFKIVARVIFADILPIYQARSENYARMGVLVGSLQFVLWSLNQTSRGLYYFLFKRGRAPAPQFVGSTRRSSVAEG
ncbi:MAG: UDP-forming cellulose synthase catalytic subunit [Roseiarcus sp.]